MCGIVGIFKEVSGEPPSESALRQMLAMIRHRGPDEFGIYLDRRVGLGSARLSIIDLSGGQQPICNEDGTLWIVFNGEIFNYLELRPELESRGHQFATHTDTEVLLHLYEEYGSRCLEKLNGQFAFAIWNSRDQTLFLARDRLGIRPLFYTRSNGCLIFGSEIKAILSDPRVKAELDPVTLDQIFTFWSPLSPLTAFKGIVELPPGHYFLAHKEEFTIRQYWEPEFQCADEFTGASARSRFLDEYLEEFEHLLVEAVRLRLRADVPVGAYLSGGLDSSIIASIIRNYTQNHLDTFSISFSDVNFDESVFQRQMAQFLGTDHQVVHATYDDIGRVFPEVIWHTEIPVMRTSPAPMFLLSKLVRDSGYKVVLTGEGADEFLVGYDIFKEAKIRRFWASQPESTRRPMLFGRLYADIAELGRNNPALLAEFFRGGLTEVNAPTYSHAVRWRNNRRTCRFFSGSLKQELAGQSLSAIEQIVYPSQFSRWGSLEQAQFIEITVFMSQYLLSSQGDRVTMAHSVEGRYPFLDYRVVAFCNRLPANLKLHGLTEKYMLKKLGRKWLPREIWRRPKRPYRAPVQRSFFNEKGHDYVRELLSPEKVKMTGLFNPAAVSQLVMKAKQGIPLGETGEMALVGIISTQLVHHQFVEKLRLPPPLSADEPVKVCNRGGNK
ncbi:MAG: asparagine synthase (glutamine-hydrolyzing) [bacterium]